MRKDTKPRRRRRLTAGATLAALLLPISALLSFSACSAHSPLVERTRRMEERLETVKLAVPEEPAPEEKAAAGEAEKKAEKKDEKKKPPQH